MKEIEITETEDLSINSIVIKNSEKECAIIYNKHTGDWYYSTDQNACERYFLDKQSAISAALKELGILEDPDLNHAPDRT